MKILVLQHISCETPGFIKDLMIKDGIELTTIQLDEGGTIPQNLSLFDGMFGKITPSSASVKVTRHINVEKLKLVCCVY